MNSYNDNLHETVVASLNGLEADQKSMGAKLKTSMFSLYYAEGARITADEKLTAITTKYKHQKAIKSLAVDNNNISTNLLASANQEKTYVAKSVSNTALAAANIQIAANAILQLASDVGSIMSIAHAADYNSDIDKLAKYTHSLMRRTAYHAEEASQMAMEASGLVAEVSSNTVASKASETDNAMKNLLNVATAELNATGTLVESENAELAQKSVLERKAEGILEDVNVEYSATNSAYRLNNKELNLNLRVHTYLNYKGKESRHRPKENEYVVKFNLFRSAFKDPHKPANTTPVFPPFDPPFPFDPFNPFGPETEDVEKYPVSHYYLFLVKEKMKATFTLTDAEALIQSGTCWKKVEPKSHRSHSITVKLKKGELLDVENKPMELGTDYVVFVMAEFSKEYKKNVNNYQDFLTAGSSSFSLKSILSAPNEGSMNWAKKNVLEFTVNEKHTSEYRCILLPNNPNYIKGLLTAEGLALIQERTEALEIIADEHDPKIARLEFDINSMKSNIEPTQTEIIERNKEISKLTDRKPSTKNSEKMNRLSGELEKLQELIKPTTDKIAEMEKSLAEVIQKKTTLLKLLESKPKKDLGFFFNLTIAQKVSAANYTVATLKDLQTISTNGLVSYKFTIEDDATDNFGNRLVANDTYLPVILTVVDAEEPNPQQFQSVISTLDPEKMPPLVYNSSLKNLITNKN